MYKIKDSGKRQEYPTGAVRDTNEGKIRKEIQNYSIGWLEVSDCIYVLKNSENSKGTQNEIRVANERGIPVLYEGIDELS